MSVSMKLAIGTQVDVYEVERGAWLKSRDYYYGKDTHIALAMSMSVCKLIFVSDIVSSQHRIHNGKKKSEV